MTLILIIGRRKPIPVKSLEEASDIYSDLREKSGQGASRWPTGEVLDGDKKVARVSYNGRVWPPEPWFDGQKPLVD